MKTIYAILLLAAAGVTVSAQETPAKSASTPDAAPQSKVVEPYASCDLALQYSPIVGGLKLGMPESEAELKLSAKAEPEGGDSRRERISASLDKSVLFEGEKATNGSVTTVGDKVTSIRISYGLPWSSAKEIVAKFAPKLGLARGAFRLDDEKREASTVCKEFSVDIKSTTSGVELQITNTVAAAAKQ